MSFKSRAPVKVNVRQTNRIKESLQAPDIIREAVANGRSSSASGRSHASPNRASRGATPDKVGRTSKSRTRERTLEKEDILGTKKEEEVVVRVKKFSSVSQQQKSSNRLSGILSNGRSTCESKSIGFAQEETEDKKFKNAFSGGGPRSPSPRRRIARTPSLNRGKTPDELATPTAPVRRSASLRSKTQKSVVKIIESESDTNKENSKTTEEGQEHEYTMTENIEASQASRSLEILTNSASVAATKAHTSDIKANTSTAVNASHKSQAKATKCNDTLKATQLRGTKMKGPAPTVPPKPTKGGQVIVEGVVEEHLSAGQAILKFECESATFTAVNNMVASATTVSSVSLASSSLRIDKSEDMEEQNSSGERKK